MNWQTSPNFQPQRPNFKRINYGNGYVVINGVTIEMSYTKIDNEHYKYRGIKNNE